MKESIRSRKTAKLSTSLSHNLNMYALSASAAGVGVLALASPAEGKIVYTPAHKSIIPNHTIPLDLNHDGIIDFAIQCSVESSHAILRLRSSNANEVSASYTGSFGTEGAVALHAGRSISVPTPTFARKALDSWFTLKEPEEEKAAITPSGIGETFGTVTLASSSSSRGRPIMAGLA